MTSVIHFKIYLFLLYSLILLKRYTCKILMAYSLKMKYKQFLRNSLSWGSFNSLTKIIALFFESSLICNKPQRPF